MIEEENPFPSIDEVVIIVDPEGWNHILLDQTGIQSTPNPEEVRAALKPLLDKMSMAEQRRKGHGVYELRRFVHRVVNGGKIAVGLNGSATIRLNSVEDLAQLKPYL